MGEDTHWTHTPTAYTSDVAGSCRPRVVLDISNEEHHQLCSALEGVEDPCRSRPRRAGKGTRGESEVQSDMRYVE
jgi:hypothetical protein